MLPSKTNMLRRNGNPMLNVEQYKRYLALQTRLHGNSMLNVEEYSEYVQLHTQFQDSIYAQPTVSNELINQRDVENDNVESNVEAEIIVEKNVELQIILLSTQKALSTQKVLSTQKATIWILFITNLIQKQTKRIKDKQHTT